MDVELVLRETPFIGIYKDVLKYSDIHIIFGTASLWNQSYFLVLYILIFGNLCDVPYLLNPIQPMDMELVLFRQSKDGVL